jgi:putative FmdB family regulatory protein
MPFYDYRCADCGPFQAPGSLQQSAAPALCPSCLALSERVIRAPYLNTMNGYRRIAHERNERSAHEPRVMSRAELDGLGRRKDYCGHSHAHENVHNSPDGVAGVPGKPKMVRSSRPWMIGH